MYKQVSVAFILYEVVPVHKNKLDIFDDIST